jgi:hypothetical protein
MKTVERLHRLEQAGVELSRNRNYDLFEQPDNRRVLSLNRYLDMLASEIREGEEEGSIELSLNSNGNGRLALYLHRTSLAIKHTAHLDPEEVAVLMKRTDIARIFAEKGIEA